MPWAAKFDAFFPAFMITFKRVKTARRNKISFAERNFAAFTESLNPTQDATEMTTFIATSSVLTIFNFTILNYNYYCQKQLA